eukprot:9067202-Pyramimonas_sp.AAC.1
MEVEEGRFRTDGTWLAGDRERTDAFQSICGSWAELSNQIQHGVMCSREKSAGLPAWTASTPFSRPLS